MRSLTIWRIAKDYLNKQHLSCHQAWKFYIDRQREREEEEDDDDGVDDSLPSATYELLNELGNMARRDALNLSITLETNNRNPSMKDKMVEVCGHILLWRAMYSRSWCDQVGTLFECMRRAV